MLQDMIIEISITKKRILIIGCIIISLLIHLTPLKMHLYTNKLFRLPNQNPTQQLSQPSIALERSIKPLMLTKQLPPKKISATQPFITQSSPTAQPLVTTPTPPLQSLPEEPASTHKIFRAGTGFDAPMTDQALTPAKAKAGKMVKRESIPAQANPI